MYPLGCSLCRKVKNLDAGNTFSAIEEVQLGEQKIKYVRNAEEFERHNPLEKVEKVGMVIKPRKEDPAIAKARQ